MTKRKTILTLPAILIHETEEAYLISLEDGPKIYEKIWIPKSLCEFDETDNELQIEEWFAIEHEMV